MSDVRVRFFNGDYSGLVKHKVDNSSLERYTELDRAYLIGALVFVGRRHDARAEFAAHLKDAALDARVIAQFFLGVGACRDSEYAEGRKFFSENYLHRLALNSDEARFFVYQGLGFFRFFRSRFVKSVLWSERAWKIAFASRFHYGMILSADLRGHGLMYVGRVSEGLMSFSKAIELCAADDGVKAALEISTVCYQAQFGLLNRTSLELHKRLRAASPSDTYSRSNLLLELVRALIIEGKVDEALEWLDNGTGEIFKFGQRRQKAALLARRAHALILKNRKSEAEAAIAEGLSLLEEESDLLHRLELLGMKSKLEPANLAIHKEMASLARRSGCGMARHILTRGAGASIQGSDDFLGVLLDHLAIEPKNIEFLLQAERKGWLGLFNRVVEREAGLVFYLELLPGRLVIFQEGNVHISSAPVSGNLKRLLIILAQGPADKMKLVETVWGYKYNSLRHDPMLYNSIYRLRALLGGFEKYLLAGENGYFWSEPVKTRVFERPVEIQQEPIRELSEGGLSLRQHRALQLIRRESAVSVTLYAKALKVAKATATRDLAEMVNRGYLVKTGRARATNYVLKGTL